MNNTIHIGPWQQLRSDTVYDNPWIRVDHQQVITPAGTPGIYGRVHMKNHAVGIIPIDDEGNTWLVKQCRYPLAADSWEIPEGGAPLGEDPLAAARRELQEECGLQAQYWQKLLSIHTSNSVTDEAGTVFVAKGLKQVQQQLEDSESDLLVRKLPLEQAIAMALQGDITDSLSLAGLLKIACQGHD